MIIIEEGGWKNSGMVNDERWGDVVVESFWE